MNGGSSFQNTKVIEDVGFLDQLSSDILIQEETPSTSFQLEESVPLEVYSPDLTQAIQESKEKQSVLPLLKSELKYKILYKRHAEGKDDIEIEEEGPRVYELTEDDIRRRLLRRQRNRESAERTKQKEIKLEEDLKRKIDTLTARNSKLEKTKSKLMIQKQDILSELQELGCKPDGVTCTCKRGIKTVFENPKTQSLFDSSHACFVSQYKKVIDPSACSTTDHSNMTTLMSNVGSRQVERTDMNQTRRSLREDLVSYERKCEHISDLREELQSDADPQSPREEQDVTLFKKPRLQIEASSVKIDKIHIKNVDTEPT